MNEFVKSFARTANIWRGLAAVFLGLMLTMVFATQLAYQNKMVINSSLGLTSSKTVQKENAEIASYYKSDYVADVKNPTEEEFNNLLEASKQQAINEMEEGAILLRNNVVGDKTALPLDKGARVSMFGHASEDPLYKPYSGAPGYEKCVNVYDAMRGAGFVVNSTLYNAYANARRTGSYGGGSRNDSIAHTDWHLHEVTKDFYNQSGIRASYANYNDAAVVFIGRTAGEHSDCPTGRSEYDLPGISVDDTTKHYLELSNNEIDMLNEVKAHFDKIILILNTANLMEIGWLDEYEIDAVLYTAGYGAYGSIGMANILCGDANPSGRLVDTWAYDFMSAPAMANFGAYTYTNASEMLTRENGVTDGLSETSHYVVYAEGIYIGYKYYETRYEDVILGRGDAGSSVGSSTGDGWIYDEEVQYPFGYGMSYTDFSLEIVDFKDNGPEGEEFSVDVKVTNTGNVAGKRSVQLYIQAPYVDYGVEKSAVQLVNFGKTGVIEPGHSETITIKADKYLLASYDYQEAEGYILDAGDYYFAVGDSVHDALNYILAEKEVTGMKNVDGTNFIKGELKKVEKWHLDEYDDTSFRHSRYGEKVEVTNRLEEADLNYWLPDTVEYLTRSDWSGTYPTEPTEITLTAEMAREIGNNFYDSTIPEDAPAVSDFKQGVKNNISFVDMYGVDYDNNEIWEKFIDQLTIDEMLEMNLEHWGSGGASSIAKPYNWNNDGPDGISGRFKAYDLNGNQIPFINGECTMFTNEIVLAQTYNYDLIRNRGLLLGEESMFASCPQLWSPGADLHRTMFAGRNFEYYSEDANLSYLCAAVEVKAMREKGVVTAIKHFCGNNQETYRQGLSTFTNEQAFRQNDMRGFEGAFTLGKSNSTMTSFSRVGMRSFPHNGVMQNDILRGEWGFKGAIISDGLGGFMHQREGLASGTDMWCLSAWNKDNFIRIVKDAIAGGDGYMLQLLRTAAKNFCYAYCNSNLTNGLSSSTEIITVRNWWEDALDSVNIALIVASVTFGVLFVGSTVAGFVLARKEKANA